MNLREIFFNENSQKGFGFVLVIFIVIIIFSISIVSGAAKFEYSPEPPSKLKSSVTPTATPSATTIPNPSPIQDSQWSLSTTTLTCTNGVANGVITAVGPVSGYVEVQIREASGSYRTTGSDLTVSPSSSLGLDLPSAQGYSTSDWRLNLYEGGTGSKNNFSGGTLRVTVDGSPTGCT